MYLRSQDLANAAIVLTVLALGTFLVPWGIRIIDQHLPVAVQRFLLAILPDTDVPVVGHAVRSVKVQVLTATFLPKEILDVRFANMAAKTMGYSLEDKDYSGLDILNIESADQLRVNFIQVTKLKEQLTEEMKGVMELF